MRWHPSEIWYPSERWCQGAEKEARIIFEIVFSHPHRRDGTGFDLNDVNPKVSATAPGPRGDIKAPLPSRTITTGTCVVSTLFTRGNKSSCFPLIGMKIERSQPSSQHTYGTRRLQPPRSQKELESCYSTWCRRGKTRTTVGSERPPKKAMPQIDTVCDNPSCMVSEQKERPVATRQNQTGIRPPTTKASFVYQTPMPVLLYRIPPHRRANWQMHCVLVM